ncbi:MULTISPECIES: HAMP domain-containing sensor histidine kinase [Sulfurimonas]|uniref:sensor histidine kinase n=1 Tax=Sulfurimonas TaxID=202746 RepID=UPI00126491E0|nr:HAMP domain-containing sensor histidine kinase [Sulfurimonas indica]
MKKVEKESLLKSFLLFFISQSLLVGALFVINYQKELQTLDEQIFSKMRICSFDLRCTEFGIDFVPKKSQELYKLYKKNNELSSYFTLPGSQKNYLKIYLQKSAYDKQVANLRKSFVVEFLLVLAVIALLSFVFSVYTLSPLRNALHLTEEFIKDILHDFNTPLSTLRLNTSMLVEELGENTKIKRVQNAVQNILNLQSNLRAYLHAHESQKESFDLSEFIQERVELLEFNYKDVKFMSEVPQIRVETNRDALSRIVDNLLSNAGKYNIQDGKVYIRFENEQLIIKDTGKGIKNPKRVFERFYKEQERGIGIGLHIVKKLCDELGITIALESELGRGSLLRLNLHNILKR